MLARCEITNQNQPTSWDLHSSSWEMLTLDKKFMRLGYNSFCSGQLPNSSCLLFPVLCIFPYPSAHLLGSSSLVGCILTSTVHLNVSWKHQGILSGTSALSNHPNIPWVLLSSQHLWCLFLKKIRLSLLTRQLLVWSWLSQIFHSEASQKEKNKYWWRAR